MKRWHRGHKLYRIFATNIEDDCLLVEVADKVIEIWVGSVSQRVVDEILYEVASLVPPSSHVEPNTVQLNLWMTGPRGPRSNYKTITAPEWTEVERNYPEKVRKALHDMVATSKPADTGKIILWHGEPGTGKTSAIRMLAREWKSWCVTHYITDAERLFADPDYLMEVSVPDGAEWRLVVCEDTDEFINSNARKESGFALSRLLNFADGILGQGCNTLFLLTTNEKISHLHPALVRPGRCLAQIEFEKFNWDEQEKWYGDNVALKARAKSGGATLAEMFEQLHHTKIATGEKVVEVGTYL